MRVLPLARVVERLFSTTFSTRASISGFPSRSTRRKRMPKLGGDGKNVIVTRFPLCKPMPEKVAGRLSVCCCSTSALNRPVSQLASRCEGRQQDHGTTRLSRLKLTHGEQQQEKANQ